MDRLLREYGLTGEGDRDTRLGVPGKSTLTSRLAPAPKIFLKGTGRDEVGPDAESAVAAAATSGGSELRGDVRDRFERSLGADLSGVRVHTGDPSAEAAAAVSAKAYTVGNDIHFGAGQYQPDDPFGLHLLAHEVAHTVQQSSVGVQRQHKLEVSSAGDALEVEADRAADAMVAGRPAAVSGATSGTLARKDEPETPTGDARSAEKEAEWAAKGAAASKAIDDAGHTVGGAATGGGGTAPLGAGGTALPQWFMDLQNKLMLLQVWEQPEEAAQQVLEGYANWYVQSYHGGKVPPSIASMFQYIGRSSQNAAAAKAGGMKNTGHYGGQKGSKNWCTQTTTTGVLDGLASLGYAPQNRETFWNTILFAKPANGEKMTIAGGAAYTAPLLPGDMIMYLFEGCQYGGHTVTVVDDQGDSFSHVSGNTGAGIGAGVGVAKRLKTPPTRNDGKAFVLGECNKIGSAEEKAASTAYIAGCNWGGKENKLVYSITRFSYLFEELGQLADIDPATQGDLEQQIMTRYKLKKIAKPTTSA